MSFGNDAGLGTELEIKHDKTRREKPILKCALNTITNVVQIFEIIFYREIEIKRRPVTHPQRK